MAAFSEPSPPVRPGRAVGLVIRKLQRTAAAVAGGAVLAGLAGAVAGAPDTPLWSLVGGLAAGAVAFFLVKAETLS